jgi:hypothetical protein
VGRADRNLLIGRSALPELEAPRVRISRESVRGLWWGYVAGLGLCALPTAYGVLAARPSREGWTGPEIVCLLAAFATAIASDRLMSALPPAGHAVFDAVGERFEFAMRQLFLRFVLAGAAAEVTGLLGAVLYVLGTPAVIAFGVVALGLFLLTRLRRRVAPLVHYLA